MAASSKSNAVIASADELLAACELKVERIHIDAFGRDMFFREMTIGNLDVLSTMNDMQDEDGNVKVGEDVILDVLTTTICDENGSLLFNNGEGRVSLQGLPFRKMQDIFVAACQSIQLTQGKVEEKKSG